MRRFNLVLATMGEASETTQDLELIARRVEQADPRINAVVLRNSPAHRLSHVALWASPTLSVAMQRTGPRTLLPGRILTSRTLLKDGEYNRLQGAGFAVPKWAFVRPDTVLDPAVWGPYVIEKPNFGGRGANVRIRRTGRVKYQPPASLAKDHLGRRGMLAQEFIFTGEWPQSYRVLTLLGQTILCIHQTTVGRGEPLAGRWGFGKGGGRSVVSNTREMDVTLVREPSVMALCEAAHRAAFPDVPLLGFDVIRDAESGKLYILECHSHGPLWPFSTTRGRGIDARNGIEMASQFDALTKCAAILAEATPRLATMRLPFQTVEGKWT
ncbi:MAG: hypothetical protein NTV73_13135 [Hyphomicrobiales bacterium]|nr:hypothetical protein [Hyphomicrobiales bacterium]